MTTIYDSASWTLPKPFLPDGTPNVANYYWGGWRQLNKTAITLASLSDSAAIWGQFIPISWGRRKLNAPMMQLGQVDVKFSNYVEYANEGGGWSNFNNQYDVTYVVDYAVALGYAGDRDKVKTVRKIWINDVLKYDAAENNINNLQFSLYQGTDTQEADPRFKRNFADQLAYRGLMYLIINDMPAVFGKNGLPKVEVELWDAAGNAIPVTDYTTVDSTFPDGTSIPDGNIAYDAKKRIVYAIASDRRIHKFDATSAAELANYPVTGTSKIPGYNPATTSFPRNAVLFADCETAAQKYLFFQATQLGNTGPMVLVDADSGAVLDVWGEGYGNFINVNYDKAHDNIGAMFDFAAFTVRSGSTSTAYAITGDIPFLGGQMYLWKLGSFDKGTDLKLLDYRGFPGAFRNAIPGPVDLQGNATVYLLFDSGRVAKYTILASGGITFTDNVYLDPDGNPVVALFTCPSDGSLIVFSTVSGANCTIKKVLPDGTVLATLTNVPFASGFDPNFYKNTKTYGVRVGWIVGSTAYQLNFFSMQLQTIAYSGPGGSMFYDALTGTFIANQNFYGGSSVPLVNIDIFNPSTNRISLATFLSQLCVASGKYAASDVEVSGISEFIDGAIIAEPWELRGVLQDLAKVYGFDIVESGTKIKLSRRPMDGSFAPDFTVTTSDLALLAEEEGDNEDPVAVKTIRTSDTSIPSKVELKYIDPDYNYGVMSYSYQRPLATNTSTKTESYGIPIVMQQAEAAALVARMNYDGWESRLEHQLRLGQKHLLREPGDVVRIEGENFTDTAKIVEATYNADWSVSIKAKNVSGVSGPVINPDDYNPLIVVSPTVKAPGDAEVLVIDTPLLSLGDDREATLEQYLATVPKFAGAYSGAQLFRSGDGVSYEPFGASTSAPVLGRLRTVLPDDASPFSIHRLDTLDVVLSSGSTTAFEACTEAAMLAGTNRLLVGAPGRWEVIGFSSVSVVSGVVRLGGYVRGLRGTDDKVGTHTPSDLVILVDGNLFRDEVPVGLLGTELFYKAVGLNRPVRGVLPQKATFSGNSMRPWAPANVHFTRSLLNNDVSVSWVRRTWGVDTLDVAGEVPFAEGELDSFELKVYNGATLVRTTIVAGTSFLYTEAMQTADGFSLPLDALRVTVAQRSSVVGNGFLKDVTRDVE